MLLDNAGKWAWTSVTITIVQANDGAVDIAIRDDGAGMDDEQIVCAFEIGSRFDAVKPGSGLGLAMARKTAQKLSWPGHAGSRFAGAFRLCPSVS